MSDPLPRLYQKLHTDLGQEIVHLLRDPSVTEIMCNPDGRVWMDQKDKGQYAKAHLLSHQAHSIISLVAGIQGKIISKLSPHLETHLPYYKDMQGERFTAQVTPLVSAPSFCIRKKVVSALTLEDYVISQRMTPSQRDILQRLLRERQNILISGGPGTGKTTFLQALLFEANQLNAQQRWLILEDTKEIDCPAPNVVSLLTTPQLTMTHLVCAALRLRPDRLIIGEVRGREMLDVLKAWNVGCAGGFATVHANHAHAALQRVVDCALESEGVDIPPLSLIAHTVQAVVSLQRHGQQHGCVMEIIQVKGVQDGEFIVEALV